MPSAAQQSEHAADGCYVLTNVMAAEFHKGESAVTIL